MYLIGSVLLCRVFLRIAEVACETPVVEFKGMRTKGGDWRVWGCVGSDVELKL